MTVTADQLVDDGRLAIEINGEQFHHLEGRAVPFDTWGDVGLFLERHARASFTDSLARRSKLPLLLNHNTSGTALPLGISETWDARSDGLWGRWKIAPSALAQEAASWAREGGLGLSIGFQPVRTEWQYATEWDPLRGPEHMDRATRVQSRLLEVSMTPTPAFADAVIDRVEAMTLDGSDRALIAEFRHWVAVHRH